MGMRWIRWGIIAIGIIVVAAQAVGHMRKPVGDFQLHYNWGERLRSGQFLYEGGRHLPYPPAWAVLQVPFSLVPINVAKPAFLLIGVASLAALLWMLNSLTRATLPLKEGLLFWTCTATLLITARFIHRDFDDGGQNIVILCLSWLGVWLFTRGRPYSAGVSIGLAVALKCTAGLFIVYFLLKRQWTMAISSSIWFAVFFVSPILWQGPTEFVRHLDCWQHHLRQSLAESDPSRGLLGPEILQNKSLRPSLARYLMHLPPGHPGRHYVDELPEGDPNRIAHPAFVDFVNLRPQHAGWIIKVILLAGIVAVGWMCRKSLANDDPMTVVWEAAIISVLMLLYSPITWGQHCVALLPAFYLLVRSLLAQKIESRWLIGFLVGFTLLLIVTNRSFVGKSLSLLLESYHPITFALIALTAVLFVVRDRVAPGPGQGAVSVVPPGGGEQSSAEDAVAVGL